MPETPSNTNDDASKEKAEAPEKAKSKPEVKASEPDEKKSVEEKPKDTEKQIDAEEKKSSTVKTSMEAKSSIDLKTPLIIIRVSWMNFLVNLGLFSLFTLACIVLSTHRSWLGWDMFSGAPDWLAGSWFTYVILVIGYLCAPVGIYFLGMPFKERYSKRMIIYQNRITVERGFISRSIKEIFCADIRTVNVNQTFIQRLTNCGDLMVAAAGTDDYDYNVKGIPSPIKIKDIILRQKALFSSDD